jgi:hypothetical protein
MKTILHVVLSAAVLITSNPGSAETLRDDGSAAAPRERMLHLVRHPEVRTRLLSQGVDTDQVEARIAALTDEEAHALASRFDELPAGGNDGLGALLAFAVVVYFVVKYLPFVLLGGALFAVAKAASENNRGGHE